MTQTSAFRTPDGEAAYLTAYDASLKLWPVPFEEIDVPTRFGKTHVVASGPKDAPPLVLLHGFLANSTMWSPNIADFSTNYRVYAIDTMGHPGKSVPDEPIRSAEDYAAWLSATFDGLRLDQISLVGMSFGAWLALNFAMVSPERVRKLALLSPAACFLPIVKQFIPRVMLMKLVPRRFWFNSLFGWMGIKATPGDTYARLLLDLMYFGGQHFRIPPETMRVMPTVFSDEELRALSVPVLLLIGENEVLYDAAEAVARARRFIPGFEGELVPGCSHDMYSSQHETVDARVLESLNDT